MCAFDWDRRWRPWMTLNCYKFELSENFAGSQIWKATTTSKRMKIDPYCQQQNYSPLNVHFSDDCVGFAECSSARVCNENTVGANGDFQPLYAIIFRNRVVRLSSVFLVPISQKLSQTEPYSHLLFHLCLFEIGPLNTAMGLGERYRLPSAVCVQP